LTKDKYQSLPLYPEVSDIPFIIRLPNGKGARRSTALAQHADIMPTILDTLGLSIPKSVEGTSLKPVFSGKDDIRPVAVSAPTFSSPEIEIPHPTTRISVTDGQWMFIFGSQVDPGEPELTRMVDSRQRTIAVLYGPIEAELYDLSADPGCTKNVLAQNKDVARTLHAGLLEFLEKTSLKDEHRNFFEKPSDEML